MDLPTLNQLFFEYQSASSTSNKFKSALELYINTNPQSEKSEIVSGLQNYLSAEMVFEDNLIKEPMTLFRVLKDYLVLNEFGFCFRR